MKTSAILLVGGMGTRLMPLTSKTPKPMLQVAGVPFTEHQIRKAAQAGISEIVLATSYKAELFEPYFGNGEKFGIKIKYAVEKIALGTGGGIRNAASLLDECDQVVIFNGDVLSGHDLSAQIQFHIKNNAEVTLYLTKVSDARAYGCVELSADNQVKSFLEKMENPVSDLINAGCYIFNRKVIDQIPANQVISVERDTSYWLDIGNPAALVKASADLITGVITSPATPKHIADHLIAPGAQVSPTATINLGSVIESEVVIESNCLISGSIIGKGVKIGANCQVIDSIIAPDTQIEAGMVVISNYLGF